MTAITAIDIDCIYDPYVCGTAPSPNEPIAPNLQDLPSGAVPAALEYIGLHGKIIAPLYAVPSAQFLTHPDLAPLGELHTLKFQEQEDGSWKVLAQGEDIHLHVWFAMEGTQMQQLLQHSKVPLFGKPTAEELAEQTTETTD